jgi:hypothetical protein
MLTLRLFSESYHPGLKSGCTALTGKGIPVRTGTPAYQFAKAVWIELEPSATIKQSLIVQTEGGQQVQLWSSLIDGSIQASCILTSLLKLHIWPMADGLDTTAQFRIVRQ